VTRRHVNYFFGRQSSGLSLYYIRQPMFCRNHCVPHFISPPTVRHSYCLASITTKHGTFLSFLQMSIYIHIEPYDRYIFTENGVTYVGELTNNRHSTLVSYICNFTDSSDFLLQINGELHYTLTFNDGTATVAFSKLQIA
jgi:hypothetical protein